MITKGMKRAIQHEPLLIRQSELSHWSFPIHTHNFYELVMIRKGTGQHIINGNRFSYGPEDVFLLCSADNHYFIIEKETSFYFLTFTESYLNGLANVKNTLWKPVGNYSLHISQGLRGSLVTNSTDQQHLHSLLSILLVEQNATFQPFSPIIDSLMGAILSLIERQITQQQLKLIQSITSSADLIQRVVGYIVQHITQPDHLRIEQLADVFHYSPGHLSALFKQQVGESLQQYIIQYKLKLVEKRLRLSTLTVSQIADEFGFTDICHLNKLFKRYYQHTPMVYRRGLPVF